MKGLLTWLLALALYPCLAQEGFEKGNALYAREQYAEAVKAYESELERGVHSAALYFNLANAYYKLDKVAPAVYNYERALLLDPNDRDIQTNLGYAHNMMVDEVRPLPRAGFGKLLHDFTGMVHHDTWGWMAIALSVATLLLFTGYYFSAVALQKRLFFFGMLLFGALTLIAAVAGLYERERLQAERPAIVFDPSATVKGEPRMAAPEVITVHEGTKLYVLEQSGEWKKVLLPDGNDGWIRTSAIREVKISAPSAPN